MTVIDHAFLSGLVDGDNINVRYRFIDEHDNSVMPAIVVMGVVVLRGKGERTIMLPQVDLIAASATAFQVQILTMDGRIIQERALDLPLFVVPGSHVRLRHFSIAADTT